MPPGCPTGTAIVQKRFKETYMGKEGDRGDVYDACACGRVCGAMRSKANRLAFLGTSQPQLSDNQRQPAKVKNHLLASIHPFRSYNAVNDTDDDNNSRNVSPGRSPGGNRRTNVRGSIAHSIPRPMCRPSNTPQPVPFRNNVPTVEVRE